MEEVQQIREYEKNVLADITQLNEILAIKKVMKASEDETAIQLAGLHSLRRIFIHFLDTHVVLYKKSNNKNENSNDGEKQVHIWLKKQYAGFKSILLRWIASNNGAMIAPSIRTLMEFVKRDYLQVSAKKERVYFGYDTYFALIQTLLTCPALDVDVVLMVRQEIFSLSDCSYYALKAVCEILRDHRVDETATTWDACRQDSQVLITNALDILRVMTVHDQISTESMWVGDSKGDGQRTAAYSRHNNNKDTSNVSDSDSEGEPGDVDEEGLPVKTSRVVVGTKRKMVVAATKPSKRATSAAEEVRDPRCHRKVFGKAWLALLALPLSPALHKLVLKHLPAYVMPHMSKPLLLADYLTQCYALGGVLAVLALESLFHLVASHNLDYPLFFVSLYRLCSIDVFSAKYRPKFTKLLSAALKSTNLPAYMAAAFIKRFMYLALHAPTPAASFCIAQVYRLLQAHPQCLALIHRHNEAAAAVEYDVCEERHLEECKALHSSLWEAEALLTHYCPEVADLTKQFKESVVRAGDIRKAPIFRSPDECLEQNYADMIVSELGRAKKNGALAFQRPAVLFPLNSAVGITFSTI